MNYIKFQHILRNKNEEADKLANLAINKWGKRNISYQDEIEIIDQI